MLTVGQSAQVTRKFSERDFFVYEQLCGVPVSEIPEPLIAALFSYLLGVKLPGSGTNYLKQELKFIVPAPLEATLTARVEITDLRADKHLVDLWASCTLEDGTVICEGRSLVKAKDVIDAFPSHQTA